MPTITTDESQKLKILKNTLMEELDLKQKDLDEVWQAYEQDKSAISSENKDSKNF